MRLLASIAECHLRGTHVEGGLKPLVDTLEPGRGSAALNKVVKKFQICHDAISPAMRTFVSKFIHHPLMPAVERR